MNLSSFNNSLLETAIAVYPSLEYLPQAIQKESMQLSSVHHERLLQDRAIERVRLVVHALATDFFVDVAHMGVVFDAEEKIQTHSQTLTHVLNVTYPYKGLFVQSEVIAILRELITRNPPPKTIWEWCDFYWCIMTGE